MNNYQYCKCCHSIPCCCPVQVLTTGPFRVPTVSNNTNSVDLLIIGLKNHTNQQRTVRVTLDRCPEAIFPATTPETTTFTQNVTLDPHECTQIQLFRGLVPPPFLLRDLLRVTFEGDIDKEATKIEATVVGRDNVGGHESTMFFRHDDLVKASPKHH